MKMVAVAAAVHDCDSYRIVDHDTDSDYYITVIVSRWYDSTTDHCTIFFLMLLFPSVS